jgi:hypothetical protein
MENQNKMLAKKATLSKVMKAAWTIYRERNDKKNRKKNYPIRTFSQALKAAWEWAKKTLSKPKAQEDRMAVRIHWESEKCIGMDIVLACVVTDQTVRRRLFFPKSQVDANNTVPMWLWRVKVEEAKNSTNHNQKSMLEVEFID